MFGSHYSHVYGFAGFGRPPFAPSRPVSIT